MHKGAFAEETAIIQSPLATDPFAQGRLMTEKGALETGKCEQAVELALKMANDASHGYDQTNRWGPDYDCSSFLCTVWQEVGVPVKDRGATYTGNMLPAFLAAGFADVTGSVNRNTGAGLQAGDVLLNVKSHTAMFIGAGRVVQASGNEKGGITGGVTGDQTGREIGTGSYYNFPWDHILRYREEEETVEGALYTVRQGDTLWDLAERWLGSGLRYPEIMEENALPTDEIYVGQMLRRPETGGEREGDGGNGWTEIQLPALETGGKGHSVTALQALLFAAGIALPEYGMDGEFGPETEKAVLQYQKQQGLVESGKADRDTWKALLGGR